MDEVGIPVDQQELTFAGRTIEDGCTLKDYNIQSGSTLQLSLKVCESMKIFLKMPTGKKISLEEEPDTSVRNVKKTIENHQGIPRDDQRLIFVGQELKDDSTLKDYHIKNKSTLKLSAIVLTEKR